MAPSLHLSIVNGCTEGIMIQNKTKQFTFEFKKKNNAKAKQTQNES